MSDTASGFGGMFTDPTVMSLLGAAQGFGQAAMPSRMPIPMGAAIGMGAGGFGQGARAAYGTQMAQAQAEQAALQTKQLEAIQPYLIAQNKAIAGGFAGAAPGSSGGESGGAAPLIDPRMAAMMAFRSALSGNPRAASSWLNYIQSGNPSGGGYYIGQDLQSHPVPGANEGAAGRAGTTALAQVPAKVAAAWGNVAPALAKEGLLANPDGSVTLMPGYAQSEGIKTAADAWGKLPAEIQKAAADAGFHVMQNAGVMPPNAVGGTAALPSGFNVPALPSSAGAGMIAPADYASRVRGAENSTGNPAATNPNSSAMGNGQFINGTWEPLVKSAYPQQTAGMSDQQILSLRANPALSAQMTVAYARQNAPILQQAGVTPNAGTLALAHRFGPQGAIAIMQAPPGVAASSVLPPDVIQANPALADQTVGQLRGNFQLRFGTAPVDFSGIQEAGVQHVAPGVTERPAPGGGTVVTDTRPQQKEAYAEDLKDLQESTDELNQLQQSQTRIFDMRNMARQLPDTGAGGTFRTALANYARTYLPAGVAQGFLEHTFGMTNTAAAQQLAKLQLQNAGLQEKEAVGARGGARLTDMYVKANPGLDLLPKSNEQIANLMLMSHQMDIDYLRGLHNWVADKGASYISGKSDYVPAAQFDKQWVNQRNPQVYLSATEAMNGLPFAKWTKGLSNDEIGRAISIIKNVDPTTQILWADGQPRTFGAPPQTASATP